MTTNGGVLTTDSLRNWYGSGSQRSVRRVCVAQNGTYPLLERQLAGAPTKVVKG